MSKPIVVIYFPDNFMTGSGDSNWIYEYMQVLNGESPTNNKWYLTHDYTDYHWFCFYKYDIQEPELKVFYEKDFTEIQYQELKQLINEAIKSNVQENLPDRELSE